MSDNVPVVPGTGATSSVSTLDLSDTVFAVATGQVQRMAPMYRAGATAMEVSGSAPLPIAIASGGAPATVTLTNPAAAPLATVAVGTVAGLPTVTLSNPAAAPLATVAVATLVVPTLSVIPPATVAVGTLAGLPTVSIAGGSVGALISGSVSLAGGATVAAVPPQLPLTATYKAGVGPATVVASGLLRGFSLYANATDVSWQLAGGASKVVRNGALDAFNPAGSYVNPAIAIVGPADYIVEYQSS